jgi:hypothetical protein
MELETYRVAGARYRKAGGGWWVAVGEIITFVIIIV